jgi:hypothetical protein
MTDTQDIRLEHWLHAGLPSDDTSLLLFGITDDDISVLGQRVMDATVEKMAVTRATIFSDHLTVQ